MEDRFAVAVNQCRPRSDEDSDARTTVGHLLRELNQVLWYFLLHGGDIDSTPSLSNTLGGQPL